MPDSAWLRTYRSIRYRTPLRGLLDAISRACLRVAGLMLTRRHERQLFVIGHMRSGSTLLSNMLCNNPAINGYGEAKVVFSEPRDTLVLRGKVAMVQLLNRRRPTRRAEYLYDKILHGRLLPNTAVLGMPTSRVIFLLRPPEPTLRSIVGSFGWSVDHAEEYLRKIYLFVERLARDSADVIDGVVVPHADLIDRSEEVLGALSAWLELNEPLRTDYDPKATARIIGSGDTSDRIDTGRVVRRARRHEVDLGSVDLGALEQMYDGAVAALLERFPSWSDRPVHASPPE